MSHRLQLPEIEQIVPQVVVYAEDARIELRGRNLAAEGTSVEMGGRPAAVRAGTSSSLIVTLAADLDPGIVTVRVVRDMVLGEPPSKRRLYESSPASFVLRPVLVELELDAENHGLRLRVEPPVRAGSRPMALLNSIAGEPRSYSLPAEPPSDGGDLWVRTQGVERGTYLVRVHVNGVTSPLEVESEPSSPSYQQYTGPQVEVP